MLFIRCMKTTLATLFLALTSLAGARGALADVAPIGPDFVSAAPRAHIDRSLVASPAMNRIDPLDVVAFSLDSTFLSGDSVTQVDAAAKWLRRHPDHKIVLEGHTDQIGRQLYNEDLSTRRMAAIRNRLLGWGIAADRIVMITYGEREAIDPENPNDRRVVMFATKQAPQAVIASQLEHRSVIVATWTDRNSLIQLQPGGKPPVARSVISRR